jgi:CHAT domain-containing protein
LVVPSDSGLPEAEHEREYLLGLTTDQRKIQEVPATFLDVIEALSRGEHDGWHFTGHGQFADSDPNRSSILLERKQQLHAAEICGRVSNCGIPHPLVFLNACQTGRQALSLTGMGGWARNFIDAGATGFVGSMWSVHDHAANQFAQTFYSHLLQGKPIGQAVRDARLAIRSLNNPSWLAYTVFADPLATVK